MPVVGGLEKTTGCFGRSLDVSSDFALSAGGGERRQRGPCVRALIDKVQHGARKGLPESGAKACHVDDEIVHANTKTAGRVGRATVGNEFHGMFSLGTDPAPCPKARRKVGRIVYWMTW